MLAIVSRTDWSGERKMEEILHLDARFGGKDSIAWGTLLGVTPPAVRGYGDGCSRARAEYARATRPTLPALSAPHAVGQTIAVTARTCLVSRGFRAFLLRWREPRKRAYVV